MSEIIKYYSIKELFSSDNYVIPVYQRNYAWGESEITQLIQDIVDYYKKTSDAIKDKPNYYIGSLIAYERKSPERTVFETIDGQQRLTTLTILLSLIKNEYKRLEIDLSFYQILNLSFDCRPASTKTLRYLFNGDSLDGKDCHTTIKQGYEISKKGLNKILGDFSLSINDFCSYLFNKVKILMVLVPEDTDLNHYFEIMNSRGEQLEKHEVLKAKMLEILDENDRYAFNLIWEACSNMEKYVQYGFSVGQRDIIFGENDWNTVSKLEDVYNSMKAPNKNQSAENTQTLKELLENEAGQYSEKTSVEDESPERFNTIINFSNFLLHILRIQTKENIPLDDKRLLDSFDRFLEPNFVKQFGYNLLKGKLLFDKYIIKREFTKGVDRWSLKRLKWYDNRRTISYVNTFVDDTDDEDSNEGINRDILMLLAMFHVSMPTLVYKHWLNAALKYVFENDNVTGQDYKDYLENLAKAFLFDRFLANDPEDYFNIIYINHGRSKNADLDTLKLNQGTAVENFVFNYLDYLLWQNYKDNKEYFKIKSDNPFSDNRIENFEYTFRSSVEHYYPQSPIDTNRKLQGDIVDNFGNLCLISSSKNSRLSNYMPNAKKEHYNNSQTIDSIKQRIMMEYENWDINEIKEHGNRMKKVFGL
ncbi:MAG: DUF262 domain-containing HNH endonuclease family protein [Bacteroidales bacterium]|jgi:hypothetical protein|nr:DUF262 domain-containing HNH endonuclease family protein [Bacteroidales bacterium]